MILPELGPADLGLFPSSGARWRPGSTEWRRNLWSHGVPHVCEYANSLFSPFLLGMSPRTIKLIRGKFSPQIYSLPTTFPKAEPGSKSGFSDLTRSPPSSG